MANYFCVFPAPDAHIEFLGNHPDAIYPYIEGEDPEVDGLPADWPRDCVDPIGFSEANHRNVDLYHWILNGSEADVTGGASLFQTWISRTHSGIDLTGDGDFFAFKSEQLPEMAVAASKVDLQAVRTAFTAWLLKAEKDYAPDEEACQAFVDEFREFSEQLALVIEERKGLLICPC